MTPPFVGREREMGAGTRALRTSRVVAICGAAGVGKSRLMAELVAKHSARGSPVYAVTTSEATRSVPLSPLIGLLRSEPPPDLSLLTAAIVGAVREGTPPGRAHLIAIDDAHHLDDGSVAAIAALLAGTTTTVLMTVRDEADRSPSLSALLRQDQSASLDLSPLSAAETRALVESTAGCLTDDAHRELWRLTRGNPLMIRELVARSSAPPRDDVGRRSGPLPAGALADLVRERLRTLGPELADVLRLVAVGAPLPLSLVREAAGPPTTDELVGRGLVEVTGSGSAATIRPAHPMDGEVLRAALTPAEFARICDRLTLASGSSGAEVDPVRLAVWQRDGGVLRDVEVAVAGVRAALGRHDGALAESLLDPILGVVPAAAVTLMRSTALIQQQRSDEAEACLSEDSADADPETAIRLATARAFNLAFGLGRLEQADEVLRAAQDNQVDRAARLRLATERGVLAGITGDFDRAATAARGVLDEVDPPPEAVTSALVTMTLSTAIRGEIDELCQWVEPGRAASRVTSADLPFALDQIEIMAATGRLMAGDQLGFDVFASAALDDPHRHLVHWLWHMFRAVRSCVTGSLDEGLADSRAACDLSALARFMDMEPAIAGISGMVRGHTGESAGLAELDDMRAQRVDPRNLVWLDRGRAWLRAASGHVEEARRVATVTGAEAVGQHHRSYGILLLHDAVRLGPGQPLEEAAVLLQHEVSRMSGAPLAEVMARHGTALVEADPLSLMTVAEDFHSFGAHLLAAETAAQARSIWESEGAATSAARAHVLARVWWQHCPIARTPSLASLPAAPISDRVLEVALSAARGASSPQIGEDLHLSVRTVDNHLGLAYRKLGLAGREELAEVLAPVASIDRRP